MNRYTQLSRSLKVYAVIILLVSALVSYLPLVHNPLSVAAAPIDELNFQARLLEDTGALVPDGDYNVEFKLYDTAAAGSSAQGVCVGGGTDDCVWVETRTGGNQVTVKNGYLYANLGSVTAFGAGIDWSQELWLTFNVGGTGAASWDGEMSPRMKLTSVPFAFASDTLDGIDSTGFAQLGVSTAQTDASTDTTLFVNKTGATGNIFALQDGGTTELLLDQSANLTVGSDTDNGALILADGSGAYLTLQTVGSSDYTVSLNITGDCTGLSNGGALTINGSNQIVCSNDDGGGVGNDLQGAYTAGSAGDQTIDLSSANDSIIISNPTSSGTDSAFVLQVQQLNTGTAQTGLLVQNNGTGESFRVNDVASDTTPFVISATGDVGIGLESPNAALDVVSTATTGNGAEITASSLTTGTGLQVTSGSNALTSGVVQSIDHTATYTNELTLTGGVLSVVRDLSSNVTATSNVTYDSVNGTTTHSANSNPSTSFSHTISDNPNQVLIVTIANQNGASIRNPTYVRFDGEDLTMYDSQGRNNGSASIWYLVNPPEKTANITMTFSNWNGVVASATNYYNVDQTTPLTGIQKTSGNGTSATVNVTSDTGDLVIDSLYRRTNQTGSDAEGAGQTEILDVVYNTLLSGNASYESGAASVTMSYTTHSSAIEYAYIAASLEQLGSPGIIVEGAAATVSSDCTETANSCYDNASVLDVIQNFSESTGNALDILNAGTGAGLNISGTGTGDLAVFDATNSSANGVSIDIASSANSEYALSVTSNNRATQGLYVRADGSVGIGSAAPASVLELSHATDATLTLSRNDITITSGEEIGVLDFYGYDETLTTQNVYAQIQAVAAQDTTTDAAAGELVFYTTGTTAAGSPAERLRIDEAGNVLVNNLGNDSDLLVQSDTHTDALVVQGSDGQITLGALDCSGNANGGAITADASGVLSCTDDDGGGVGNDLQGAYTASTGGTTPEIKLDSTRNGLDIQDANTTLGATIDLLAVRASNGSGLGSELFVVEASGDVGIGTASPTTTLEIYNPNDSATQTDFTQATDKAGILIKTDTGNTYTPGLFFGRNGQSRPTAAVYTYNDTVNGTNLIFGTSNSWASGITSEVVLNEDGKFESDLTVINPNYSATKTDFTQSTANTGFALETTIATAYTPGYFFTRTGQSTPSAGIYTYNHTTNGTKLILGTSNLWANGITSEVTIDEEARVGVLDESPDAQLDVQSGSSGRIGAIIQGAASASADILQVLDSGGTELFTVEGDGDVTANTDTLFVDASTNRLGVETSSPAGVLTVGGSAALNTTTPGNVAGTIHLNPNSGTNDLATSLTFGQTSNGSQAAAGIYVQTSGLYGSKLYIATTDSYAAGSKTRLTILDNGRIGIGDVTPAALLTVGASDAFQVNSSGAIAAATGLTSSGTITFSGLDCSSGDQYLTANGSGVLSCGTDDGGGGTGEFTDATTYLYPTDSSGAQDIVIGGTTTGAADIWLQATGAAVFNEQGADADFRVEGTGEANALFVQGSDGFVGIATNAPSDELHVKGDFRIEDATDTTTRDYIWRVETNGSLSLTDSVSGERLRVDPEGDLIIGNTTCGTDYTICNYVATGNIGNHIQSGNTGLAYIQFQNSTGSGNLEFGRNTNTFGWYSNSTTQQAFTVDNSNGEFGINDVSPDAQLDVQVGNASRVGLIVQGTSSQTGDLANFLDNNGNQLLIVDSSGSVLAANSSTATTGTTEATARTNVTTVTLTAAGSFANNDVLLIDNATGQDYYTRIVSGGGTTTLTVSPAVSYLASTTVTKYDIQNIGATAADYSTNADRFFQGYFLGGVVAGAGTTTLSDGNLESSGDLVFQNNGNNVGIGTADPTATLDITSTGTTSSGLVVNADSLTSGDGISVINDGTYASGTLTGSLISVNRDLTSNDSSNPGVVYDSANLTTYSNGTAATTQTFSHTVSAKANQILIVAVATGRNPSSNPPVSVTFNGETMTEIRSGEGVNGNYSSAGMYYLVDPDVTTANVVVTMSPAQGINAYAANFYNVDQTNPISDDDIAINSASSTATLTLDSSSGDMAVDIVSGYASTSEVPGTGQTEIMDLSHGTIGRGAGSYEASTGATVAMDYSGLNGTWDHVYIAANINADSAAGLPIVGAVADFSSTCTAGTGQCNDVSSILQLSQNTTNATGTVLQATTDGIGSIALFQANDASADGIRIQIESSSSIQKALEVVTNSGATTALTVQGDGSVKIGEDDSIGTLLILDTKDTTGDPTGVAGAMYYNSALGKFRCFEGENWTDCIGSGSSGSSGFSGVKVGQATTTTLTNAAYTTLTFDSEEFDTDGYHDNTTNNSRLTAPVDGYYQLGGTVSVATIGSGDWFVIRPTINGTPEPELAREWASSSSDMEINYNSFMYLSAGDYVEIDVFNFSGGNEDTVTIETFAWLYNANGSGGGSSGGSLPSARIYRNAAWTFVDAGDNTYTTVPFDTVNYDTDENNPMTNATNTDRLTAPVDGVYTIEGSIGIAADMNNYWSMCIVKNGSTCIADTSWMGADWFARQVITTVELNAGDYVELQYFQNNTASNRTGRTGSNYTWMSMTTVSTESSLGGYVFQSPIDVYKPSIDTPDDEFNSPSLDPKWTAVSGSTGAIDILETGTVNEYDLTTRPGQLLMQASSGQFVSLRQDYAIGDGDSIVLAVSGLHGFGGTNNRVGISLNDNDTSNTSGNALHLMYEQDAADDADIQWMTGAYTAGNTWNGTSREGKVYFRVVRSGLVYSGYVSNDGTNWQFIDQDTYAGALNNIWIQVDGGGGTTIPTVAVDWIRQGDSGVDPWSINWRAGASSFGETLQGAYDNDIQGAGDIITSDGKDLEVTLSDTATDASLVVNIEGTGNAFTIQDSGVDVLTVVDGGHVLAVNVATATTGTTEASAQTNVTAITLTGDAFSVNDVLFFDNAGQDYYARVTVDNADGTYTVSPAVSYDASVTVTKYNIQNIGATDTDYATQTDRFFQGYFLGGVVTGAGSTILSDGNLESTGTLTLQNNGNALSVGGDISISGAGNFTTNTNVLSLQNTADTANNDVLSLYGGNRTTPTDGDQGRINFYLDDSTGTQANFANIVWEADDVTDTSKDGEIRFNIQVDNTMRQMFNLTSTAIVFNEAGQSTDFRVETSGDTDTLFVSGSGDCVAIKSQSCGSALDVTGDIEATGVVKTSLGTASAPGWTFSDDTDTGIYGSAAGGIFGFQHGGSTAWSVNGSGMYVYDDLSVASPSGQLFVRPGTITDPSIAFTLDGDTGIYNYGANQIGFTTNGSSAGYIANNNWFPQGSIRLQSDGSAAAPAYSFSNDTDSGLYRIGADDVGIAVNGNLRFEVNANGAEVKLNGSKTTPSLHWGTDSDTGIYRNGIDQLSFAAGGLEFIRLSEGTQNTIEIRDNVDLVYVDTPVLAGSPTGDYYAYWDDDYYSAGDDGWHIGTTYTSTQRLKKEITGQTFFDPDAFLNLDIKQWQWDNDKLVAAGFDPVERGDYYGFIAEDLYSVAGETFVSLDDEGFPERPKDGQFIWGAIAAVQHVNDDLQGYKTDTDARLDALENSTLTTLNVTGATTLAELTVISNANFEGDLTVVGTTRVADIVVNGHIISAGDTPGITAGVASGDTTIVIDSETGATEVNLADVQIEGNDTAGTVSVTTGAENTDLGEVLSIQFTTAYDSTPRVVLTAGDEKSAELNVYRTATETGFILETTSTLQPDTTYTFDYFIIQ